MSAARVNNGSQRRGLQGGTCEGHTSVTARLSGSSGFDSIRSGGWTPPKAHAFFVYTLTDPRTNRVRYVGSTVLIGRRRLALHCSTAYETAQQGRRQTPVHAWITELRSLGLKPRMTFVDSYAETPRRPYANGVERQWIEAFHEAGRRC